MVEPGAADIFADDKKKSKPGKRVAKPKVKKLPRIGAGFLYGVVAGFIMFVVWIGLYDAMSTPLGWSMASLPLPPRDAAISVGGVVIFGMAILAQLNLRVMLVMIVGIAVGGAALAGLAAFVPDAGRVLTNETFVAQMQSIVSSIELE